MSFNGGFWFCIIFGAVYYLNSARFKRWFWTDWKLVFEALFIKNPSNRSESAWTNTHNHTHKAYSLFSMGLKIDFFSLELVLLVGVKFWKKNNNNKPTEEYPSIEHWCLTNKDRHIKIDREARIIEIWFETITVVEISTTNTSIQHSSNNLYE